MKLTTRWKSHLFLPALLASALSAIMMAVPMVAQASGNSFINGFNTVSQLASTVPGNGDQNPYGLVVIPRSVGQLIKGNMLVSNFNNNGSNGGQQGTGTTIVQISPDGKASLFAQIDAHDLPGACPGGVGLTTALAVLQRGWVIVGSLPTSDGSSATAQAGCLIVLDSKGDVVKTFSGGAINGPWDMTDVDWGSKAVLFVTNVLNGTVAASPNVVNQGTVIRISLNVPEQGEGLPTRDKTTIIGSGFAERTDPAALVVGPTGVGLGKHGILYVADSANNRIAAIPDALTRSTPSDAGRNVSSGGSLNDPLGLVITPRGNILTANGNNGDIVETTPDGTQVVAKSVDKTSGTGAGCLFGLTIVPYIKGVFFVDDCGNTLDLLH